MYNNNFNNVCLKNVINLFVEPKPKEFLIPVNLQQVMHLDKPNTLTE